MARYKKKDYLVVVELLEQVNKRLSQCDLHRVDAPAILSDCQEAAITLGTNLEQQGEEGIRLTNILEEYCENLYQFSQKLVEGADNKVYAGYIQTMAGQLAELEEGICKRLPERKEVVFLPYKASMWDSLESVWMAADKDPNCDAYVIPIPYYDKKPDGSFGEFHYEGDLYPDYVPITDYREYDLEARHPDAIYIHNPYDRYNNATSIDPRFYSDELKQYTDCLVYIPYYATAGGMSEGQALCPAYLNVDYIVIQSEKYRKFFDAKIPDEKFLSLGSPKFDSVIRKCKNPSEPPEEWKKRMAGKKVYFYNTSLAGMLGNTEDFLLKMQYVFQTFRGREDACLLWRPHPLMETTFASMRKQYKPFYDELKESFVKDEIGILDLTPSIENTIALSDAYIGDAGTSVTSLFGVVGKPLFILNNAIHTLPEENDWKGELIRGFYTDGKNQWYVTTGNQLYYSPNNDYRYEYFCSLSEYAGGLYYQRAFEYENQVYVCPANAQNILCIQKDKTIHTIELEQCIEQSGAFVAVQCVGEYIFLFPGNYPYLVRFHMGTQKIEYISGIDKVYKQEINGEKRFGGVALWKDVLLIGCPDGSTILKLNVHSLQTKLVEANVRGGILGMYVNQDDVWTVPYEGSIISRCNLITGDEKEYDAGVEGLVCLQRPFGYECMQRPFNLPIASKGKLFFPPLWGNKFIYIDSADDSVQEWNSPIKARKKCKNGYLSLWSEGYFLPYEENATLRYYCHGDRAIYDIEPESGQLSEVEIQFDKAELTQHEPGFAENSQWLQYCCCENVWNTLQDFLDGTITGNQHDREQQLAAFSKINASIDGDCGEKVHQRIMENMR